MIIVHTEVYNIFTLEHKKREESYKKNTILDSNHGHRGQRDSNLPATLLYFLYINRDCYAPIRTNRRLRKLTKKRKQRPPPGDNASTAEAAICRVDRDEQGKARRASTTPNGRPHLDLGRLRLKTWSKADFSTAGTTWPTYLYIYFHIVSFRPGFDP